MGIHAKGDYFKCRFLWNSRIFKTEFQTINTVNTKLYNCCQNESLPWLPTKSQLILIKLITYTKCVKPDTT